MVRDFDKIFDDIIEQTKGHFSDGGKDFSKFATSVLESLPAGAVTAESILSYADKNSFFDHSRAHHKFSTRDVCLFANDDFYLDAYFWETQDTAIHDHTFNGAFRVIEGENVQIVYDFAPSDAKTIGFKWGNLSILSNAVQTTGTTQEICVGKSFIHQVVHVSPLVVTLCLRTTPLDGRGTNAYLYPGLEIPTRKLSTAESEFLNSVKKFASTCKSETDWRASKERFLDTEAKLYQESLMRFVIESWNGSTFSGSNWFIKDLEGVVDLNLLQRTVEAHTQHLRVLYRLKT
jgi:hypothetical protein